MRLGWAVIGAGQHLRLKMAPAIRLSSDGELVAVMSRDLARAKAFAQEFGDGHAAGYDRLEDMLQDSRIDIVYVASPNALHKGHTVAAARAGKHVLCEKPMALSLSDCECMIDACERAGVKLGVAFHLRHHPGVLKLREIIAGGKLGTLALIETTFTRGVRGEVTPAPRAGLREWWNEPEMVGAGAMAGTGIHCIDLIRFLTDQEIVETAVLTDGNAQTQRLEQLALGVLRLSDGTLATICASRRLPDISNDLIVCGSLGRATLYDGVDTLLKGKLEVRASDMTMLEDFEPANLALYVSLVDGFNERVQNTSAAHLQNCLATGRDGMSAVKTMLDMLEYGKLSTPRPRDVVQSVH